MPVFWKSFQRSPRGGYFEPGSGVKVSLPLEHGLYTCEYVNMHVWCLGMDISMMVMCDASGITGYDRRTSELSNATLLMK